MIKLILAVKKTVNTNKIRLKSTFVYVVAGFVSAIISITINPFMAKHLEPEDYAIMGYFTSFNSLLLPLFNFSLVAYYQRNYYRLADNRKKIVGDTILVAVSVSGFIAMLITLVSLYLFMRWTRVSFPFFPYALLSFAPIYLANFTSIYLIKCRLERNSKQYARITIATSLISALLALILVVFYEYGATGRMIATLISTVIVAAFCLKKLVNKMEFDWKIIKEAFQFGWPLSLSAILWYFMDGIDRTMLEKQHDTNLLGYYSVGLQIATYLTIFATAIGNVFEPDIYQCVSENNKKKLIKITCVAIILTAIPNLVFILIAPFVIGLLTYNRYIQSSDFARIFAVNNIAVYICFTGFTMLIAFGFTKAKFVLLVVGALISIFIYKIMINLFGFYGAAWGHVLSALIMTLLTLIFISFKLRNKLNLPGRLNFWMYKKPVQQID